MADPTLLPEYLARVDAYWRAANYLSVGQIYLLDNPLLEEPLTTAHVKPRLLGHWGTTPGLNFIYVHLNRVIQKYELTSYTLRDLVTADRRSLRTLISRVPTASAIPMSPQDHEGMRKLFRQFSFPGGIPEPRGARDARARFTKAASSAMRCLTRSARPSTIPNLIVACVIGDGEAETGSARDELALQQILESRARRRGAADPAFERLQDCRSDGVGAHSSRRADAASTRIWLRALLRRGQTSPRRCTTSMAHTRSMHRRAHSCRSRMTRGTNGFRSERPRGR